jgi:hypothetical protein
MSKPERPGVVMGYETDLARVEPVVIVMLLRGR